MADVARHARVSAQTVSRVLNDSPHVSSQTRERVLAAVRELGYQLNTAARALRTGRTRTFGVVTTDTVRHGPATVLNTIAEAAQDAGYAVTVSLVPAGDGAAVGRGLARLAAQSVDGIVTIAPWRDPTGSRIAAPRAVPGVTLDGSPDPDVHVVASDEEATGRLAVEHLLGLGHRTVHHLAGPDDALAAAGRRTGWAAALAAAGAPAPPVVAGDWSPASGYAAGTLLAADPTLTAVFAGNDHMAIGLVRALREAGRRVPQDVSVVGVDDVPEAAFLDPPLTTVRPDYTALGRRCVELLLRQIDAATAPTAPPRTVVPVALLERSSTAPPTS